MDDTQPITRGGYPQRLRNIWYGMRQRCGHTRTNRPNYLANYIGRGITVCAEWQASFDVFADWAMANGYESHLTIDRCDNDLGYSPGNCRWVTVGQNIRNRRVSAVDEQEVAEIKEEIARGGKYADIASAHGVKWAVIADIACERRWTDVPWPTGYVRSTRRPELLIKSNPDLARERQCKKLRFEQAVDIKKRIAAGDLFREIAADFGVSRTTVGDINSGRAWPDAEWPAGFTPGDGRKTGAPRPWQRKSRSARVSPKDVRDEP